MASEAAEQPRTYEFVSSTTRLPGLVASAVGYRSAGLEPGLHRGQAGSQMAGRLSGSDLGLDLLAAEFASPVVIAPQRAPAGAVTSVLGSSFTRGSPIRIEMDEVPIGFAITGENGKTA